MKNKLSKPEKENKIRRLIRRLDKNEKLYNEYIEKSLHCERANGILRNHLKTLLLNHEIRKF